MERSLLVNCAVAAGCLGLLAIWLPTSAIALESSDIKAVPPAREFNASDAAAILKEIKVFVNVSVSVRDLITMLEKRTAVTRVIDVSVDGQADRLTYKIKTNRGDEIWDGAIDASTGRTIGDGIVSPVSSLDVQDKRKLDDFKAAGIGLSDAVEIAERSTDGGKAVSVGLGEADGKFVLLVVVLADGSLKEVSIDPDLQQNRLRKSVVNRKKSVSTSAKSRK